METNQDPNVLLYRAKDQVEATLLTATLEGSGVRAWTVGGQAAIGFGELGADALLVDVRVLEGDHARALEIMEQYFAAPDEVNQDTKPCWTCGVCGEEVQGTFSNCWNCGQAANVE